MGKAVIATIGEDLPGLVNELAQIVLETGLNIEDSRMSVLGGEFAVLMSVAGADSALQQLEQQLATHTENTGFAYLFRRTSERPAAAASILHVTVEAVDHPGIVHGIASFFSEHGINIRELETQTMPAAHTGAPVFNVEMEVEVADKSAGETLTEAFLEFCQAHDLDGDIKAE